MLKGRFRLDPGAPRETKIRMAAHRMAEAECMDFTPRFEGRCMDYIPVDLNSYLYGYEKDLAYYERELAFRRPEMGTKGRETCAADRKILLGRNARAVPRLRFREPPPFAGRIPWPP